MGVVENTLHYKLYVLPSAFILWSIVDWRSRNVVAFCLRQVAKMVSLARIQSIPTAAQAERAPITWTTVVRSRLNALSDGPRRRCTGYF